MKGVNGGIGSSVANAAHAIGFGDSADATVAGLTGASILVKWARVGDVNLDGSVGFADLLILAQNYGQIHRNWGPGRHESRRS